LVKREEGFEIKKPVLRYTKRKSLARKGLQRKPESAKSGTEDDVEAYMEERVDEPSSEEFLMGSIPQGPAPAKIVKWQIIKTGKKGAYQIIREDNTYVVYVNFQGLLNDLTRDDLKELYRLMMLKYGDNISEEEFERSTVSNKYKDWLVQEQTALGKDFSNPFMADNLPKIVWLSTHHIYVCKELASPQVYGLCQPWTCTFLVAKGLTTPELMANCAKTTAWNEFSSTMALAIICLATNQKFNFSNYIFDNIMKNLEGGVKFLMYPRFVQVFLDKQDEGMTKHKEIYVTPSHTKKVFANMKIEGKGFLGKVTPLFQTMMVQALEELGEGSKIPTDPQHIQTIIQPSTSQLQKKQPRRKQRNQMCTYLKNMANYKHSQLKNKSFEEIHMLFDNTIKLVDSFVPIDSEVVEGSKSQAEGSKKRTREELESDNSKKQKIDENVEAKVDDEAEMKKHMEIVPDDEVAIDAIPLATKFPIIVDWKIIKEGKMGYFQIIRADGSSRMYSSMIRMLQNINREDLETFWKLVKAKHGNTRLEEAYERVLWGDLKVMFEPDVESEVWRNLQGYNVTFWKLFSSSGVHFMRF
ncbi:hypothetical protein Tco_0184099, partial [Tanacetum coccineum]